MKKAACIFFLFLFFGVHAQTKIDSLLKKGLVELYEHPEESVRIGLDVLGSEQAGKDEKSEALLLISTGYSSQRNYAKSLEYAVKAAEQIEKSESDAFKINAFSRLGLQYQQLKVYNKAHSYLDKAITIAGNSKQKFEPHDLLGFNYGIRGMVYKQQMSCDIARNYFNKSLFHYLRNTGGSFNYANISVIWYNKGNCFLSLNQIDSARTCYAKSYYYAHQIDANSLTAFANKGLAEVKTYEGDYKAAIGLLLDAEKMSANVGDLVLNQGIYKGLSENYLFTNTMEKYRWYNRKYAETTRQIEQNNTKTLNQFVIQIDTETDKEIAQTQSDALYRQIPLAAVLFILLLLTVSEILRSRKKYAALETLREKLENEYGVKR